MVNAEVSSSICEIDHSPMENVVRVLAEVMKRKTCGDMCALALDNERRCYGTSEQHLSGGVWTADRCDILVRCGQVVCSEDIEMLMPKVASNAR